jgi:type IV pilus assembly protein PilX
MFRSFGVQGKIAGNVREKNRALQAAQTAEQVAEKWLVDNATSVLPVACGPGLYDANLGQAQVCTAATSLSTVTGYNNIVDAPVPWQASTALGGGDIGSAYTPTTMVVSDTGGTNSFYSAPRFYITDIGASASAGQGDIYQIDALGYGGGEDAVAVVEATFSVYTSSWDPSK